MQRAKCQLPSEGRRWEVTCDEIIEVTMLMLLMMLLVVLVLMLVLVLVLVLPLLLRKRTRPKAAMAKRPSVRKLTWVVKG